MTSVQSGISINDPRVKGFDTSKLKAVNVYEADEALYQRIMEGRERFLEARYTTLPDTSQHPSYQNFATVEVNGKVVATVSNNGSVTSSNSVAGRISGNIPNDVNGQSGPVLAEARAEKIAELLGGEVVKSADAMTQREYKLTPRPQVSVDYEAMMKDPAYEQLQQTKKARTLFLAQKLGEASVVSNGDGFGEEQNVNAVMMNTSHGSDTQINLDDYFTPRSERGAPVDLMSIPLLLPTKENIETLSSHASSKLKALMEEYSIPMAPDEIKYDRNGRMVLPDDYVHADAFRQMIEENEAMGRELSTINALTSHYAGIQQSAPFREEMAGATSQFEREAIVDRYRYLFGAERRYPDIALSLSGDGLITPLADEKAV